MKTGEHIFTECNLCPRNCRINRKKGKRGICKETDRIRLARAALHMWEEPCISGKSGSGTVFFSGCTLHCVFCQNGQIANGTIGKEVSREHLSEIFLKLQEQGANNINLVTPDHYVPALISVIEDAKRQGLNIPIVYNTGSYVHLDTVRSLEGVIDVYLPDFKYYREETASRYANARDYAAVAKAAIAEMVRQTGKPRFYEKGSLDVITPEEFNDTDAGREILIKKGTIVRHLLLPGQEEDSRLILAYLLQTYGTDIYISILNQYTPVGNLEKYPELNRKITDDEYEDIIDFAIACGIENGFIQEGDTAQESFIPRFDYEGI